jgi:hypothetical protein
MPTRARTGRVAPRAGEVPRPPEERTAVGLFKNAKDTMGDADDLAVQMQADVSASQAAAQQPVDLTDPVWAPIDGITLDKYAQLTAAMARQNLGTSDEAQAWLEAQGVAVGTWPNVQTGWVNRMATNEAVRTRYGVLYSQS